MNFKTILSELEKVQSVVNNIKNIPFEINAKGLLQEDIVDNYKKSINGLTLSQAELALSTKELTDDQINQVLVAAQLKTSEDSISVSLVNEALMQQGVSEEEREAIKSKLGYIVAEGSEATATKICTKEKLLEVLKDYEITGAKADEILVTLGLASANSAEDVSLRLLNKTLKQYLKTKLQALATNPVTWIVGVVVAITALVAITKKFNKTLDECIEDLENYNSAFNDAQSSVESLEDEIKDCTERLEELQKLADNGTISIVEEEELKTLKETNDELERNLKIEKEKAQLAAIEGAETADTTLNTKVASKYLVTTTNIMGADAVETAYVTPTEELQAAIDKYNELSEKINNLKKSYDAGNISADEYSKQLTDLTNQQTDARNRASEMSDVLVESEQAYTNLANVGGVLTTIQKRNYEAVTATNNAYIEFLDIISGKAHNSKLLEKSISNIAGTNVGYKRLQAYTKDFTDEQIELWLKATDGIKGGINGAQDAIEAYENELKKATETDTTSITKALTDSKDTVDNFTSSLEDAYSAYNTLLSPNVSSSDILASLMDMNEAITALGGTLDWEFLGDVADSKQLDGLGIVLDDLAEQVGEQLKKSLKTGNEAFDEFISMIVDCTIEEQKASSELENLNTQLDNLQSAYSSLTDVVDSYNKTGYLTFDQLQTLLKMDSQYISCLIDENGQLRLNKDSMLELANQRLNDAEAQAVQQAISELGQLTLHDEQEAVDDNAQAFTNAIDSLAGYNDELANTIAEASVGAYAIRDLNSAITGAEENGATDDQIETVLNNLQTKLKLIQSTRDNLSSNLSTIMGDKSSSSSESSKTFDWIETALNKIEDEYSRLGKIADSSYSSLAEKNEALAKQLELTNDEISLYEKAYDKYMEKSESVSISKEYKRLVFGKI
jgi:hypothetical protein